MSLRQVWVCNAGPKVNCMSRWTQNVAQDGAKGVGGLAIASILASKENTTPMDSKAVVHHATCTLHRECSDMDLA